MRQLRGAERTKILEGIAATAEVDAVQTIIDMEPGEVWTYHEGASAVSDAKGKHPDAEGLAALEGRFRGVLDAYERGFCHPVQRRVGKDEGGGFAYLAVRNREVRPPIRRA